VVRYCASDAGDSWIPSIVNFAWFYLDFDYLSASIVDVGSNDEAFLVTVYSMLDGDDITGCDKLVRRHNMIGKDGKYIDSELKLMR